MQARTSPLIRTSTPQRPPIRDAQADTTSTQPLNIGSDKTRPVATQPQPVTLQSPSAMPALAEREHALFPQGAAITRYRVHKLGFLSQYGPRTTGTQIKEIMLNLKSLRVSGDGRSDPESLRALTLLAREAIKDSGLACESPDLNEDNASLDETRVNALVAANRPPAAHLTPTGSNSGPQLGSSLSLSRLFDTTQWHPDRLLDLHMLAFYELTPPGAMTSQIRGWFKGTCARVREQALKAGEAGHSRAMKDFNQRMAHIAESIRLADQQHQDNDKKTTASETKRLRREVIEPTPPDASKTPAAPTTTTTTAARPVLAFPVVQLGPLPTGQPDASRRLSTAHAALQRAVQPSAQMQSVERLAADVQSAFQKAAYAALVQDRLDAYQQVEAAAQSWMDQARNAMQGALPEGKRPTPEMFDLLINAPGDLIVVMQSKGIALAVGRPTPEGGEIEIDPIV